MNNKYRHGDLVLWQIKELPNGLTPTKTKVLMTGSGGNPHSIDNGTVYFKAVNEFVFGYLVAENTTLYHKNHGEGNGKIKVAKINNGVYELKKQQEKTHEGMKPVVD